MFQNNAELGLQELISDTFTRCIALLQPTGLNSSTISMDPNLMLKHVQEGSRSTSSIAVDLLLGTEGSEYLIERWCLLYQNPNTSSQTNNVNLPSIKRRISTLLRSVYCLLRLLPTRSMHPHIPPDSRPCTHFRVYLAARSRSEKSGYMSSGRVSESTDAHARSFPDIFGSSTSSTSVDISTAPDFVGQTTTFKIPEVYLSSSQARKSGALLQIKVESSASPTLRFMLNIPLLKIMPLHCLSAASPAAGGGGGGDCRGAGTGTRVGSRMARVSTPIARMRSMPIPIVMDHTSELSSSSTAASSRGSTPMQHYHPQQNVFIPAPPVLRRGGALGGFEGLSIRMEAYGLKPLPPIPQPSSDSDNHKQQPCASASASAEKIVASSQAEDVRLCASDCGTVQGRLVGLRAFLRDQRSR